MIQTLTVLLAALAGGILMGARAAALWPLGACLLLGLLALRRRVPPAWRGPVLALALLPLASCWSLWRTPSPGPMDPVHVAPLRHAVLVGTVASDPRRSPTGIRFELQVEGLFRPVPSPARGRILVRADPCELRYGQRVRVRGSLKVPPEDQNPGEFDYRSYLARNGIFALVNAREVGALPGEAAPSVVGGAIALKNACLALLDRHLPDAQAALLGSLLFGDGASPIDRETAEGFRTVGLAHVLAVSGAQILFLWGLLRGGIAALGLPPWLGVVLGCAGLWGYATMTGLPPSVVRATWMGCALVIGWAVERPWLRYLSLLAVTNGMLLHRPQLLFDVGFQFSAIATFALLHTSPRIVPYLSRLPEPAAQALAMALAAGAWVLPLQLFHFGQFSPYSLPLNALTCLMVEVVTILGFMAVLGGSLSDLLAHHILSGASLVLSAFTGTVSLALPLPGASQFLRIPPAWWLVAAYGCLAAALYLIATARPRRGLALLAIPSLLYGAWNRLDQPSTLQVVALSVGQGDGIVVRTPRGRWVLIDGGPCWPEGDAGARTILPYLRRQGCRRLEGVVLTHPHDDHAGGLSSVMAGLPVSGVWDGGQSAESPVYRRWLAAILERQVPLQVVQAGMTAELEPDVRLEVLGPPPRPHQGSRSDCNNNSVTLMLRYRGFRMLLAGDLEHEAEQALLARPDRLRAQVLKVAHHGSRYGSGEAFLRAVRPEVSVISVGESNTFRHPDPATLERLRPFGRVYRTDADGAVTVTTDGARWEVSTWRD